jgi:hypothetical protein
MNKLQNIVILLLIVAGVSALTSGGYRDYGPYLVPTERPTGAVGARFIAPTSIPTPTPTATPTPEPTPEPTPTPDPWTDDDVQAIARVLSGECYDDKTADKRRVAEVILNRVSTGHWGGTVIEVVTAKGQFVGYWHQHRAITDNDIEVAEGALRDWYAGGCEALSSYLYFSSGGNRENVFRP